MNKVFQKQAIKIRGLHKKSNKRSSWHFQRPVYTFLISIWEDKYHYGYIRYISQVVFVLTACFSYTSTINIHKLGRLFIEQLQLSIFINTVFSAQSIKLLASWSLEVVYGWCIDFEMCQGAEYILTRVNRRLRSSYDITSASNFSISLRIADKTSYGSIEDDQLTKKRGQSGQIWQIRTRENAEKN